MRRRFAIVLLLLALTSVVAACGGDDDGDDAGSSSNGTSETTGDDASGDDDDVAAAGDVDCAAIEGDRNLLIGVQVLAQIRDQGQVDLIQDGTLEFDPDAFIAAMESFRSLGGVDDDVDVYVAAAEAAKVILSNDGPVPQEDFDALEAITGPVDEVGTFLAHQADIGIAFDEACG